MGERRARQAPSWIGTLIVAVAVAVLCLRAAAALRRAVTAPPAATPPAAEAPRRESPEAD
jgi:hypothetical protein